MAMPSTRPIPCNGANDYFDISPGDDSQPASSSRCPTTSPAATRPTLPAGRARGLVERQQRLPVRPGRGHRLRPRQPTHRLLRRHRQHPSGRGPRNRSPVLEPRVRRRPLAGGRIFKMVLNSGRPDGRSTHFSDPRSTPRRSTCSRWMRNPDNVAVAHDSAHGPGGHRQLHQDLGCTPSAAGLVGRWLGLGIRGRADGGHLRSHIQARREDPIVLNFQAARLMHRHDDEWVEMSPVAGPLRRLPRPRATARPTAPSLYRCEGCDEEIQVEPPRQASARRRSDRLSEAACSGKCARIVSRRGVPSAPSSPSADGQRRAAAARRDAVARRPPGRRSAAPPLDAAAATSPLPGRHDQHAHRIAVVADHHRLADQR